MNQLFKFKIILLASFILTLAHPVLCSNVSTPTDFLTLDYGAYGQNLGSLGAFGFGVHYFSAGAIALTENDQSMGSYTPYNLAASMGYARIINDFSVGIAAKYIQSKILTSASAEAIVLGVLSPTYVDDKLRLAFALTNLGTSIKYEQSSESLPMVIRLGSAY